MSYTRRAAPDWMPHSVDNFTGGWMEWNNTPTGSVAWAVQYRALYVPVAVPERCTVRKLAYSTSSTATGNIDIGLYDAAGTRLVSSGSTAKSGVSGVIAIDVTDTAISPGRYYLALSNDTTTDTFRALDLAAPVPASLGLLAETLGSVTLPATATWTVPQTLTFVPVLCALLVTEVS